MRPEILFPLFKSVTSLPGIGPRMEKRVEDLAGPHVADLCWHLPTGLVDRRYQPKIAEAKEGEIATITVNIGSHIAPPAGNKRLPYRVWVNDDSGDMALVFFHARPDYLHRILPEGETRIISGKIEMFQDAPQMSHPDHILTESDLDNLPLVEPVYPLAQGVTQKVLQKAIRAALDQLPDLPEWQDPAWLTKQGWDGFNKTLARAHAPEELEDLDPNSPARCRLAFDELLANQLALALVRLRMKKQSGRAIIGTGILRKKIEEEIPFSLTNAQNMTLAEIDGDLKSSWRMLRLLQGDVGSGKTIVALLAMASAVEAGTQAAMMAPTEILARQHFETLSPLCKAAGISLALLTGREKGKSRDALLAALAAGEIDILVGTHALFQDDVAFKDLSLAIVDEQHRFGVHQRLQLSGKGGAGTDVLVMTATPIPRTLTLTAYGDMDVSRITEKPPGRLPIDTRILPIERLSNMVDGLKRALAAGAQAYWVCPLVEESELVPATAAEDRYAFLKAIFGDTVGMVHGRMKAAEKDAVMQKFIAGEIRVLVATTVIEVGVNVPEATIMVIEHAERFGLAQLHQLRGRVGRGSEKSSCMLLYQSPLSETAHARLKIMRDTEDGFIIAEEDLRLRGAGELLGTRQSGLPTFHFADLAAHANLLAVAHDDARLIIERDPELQSDRGQALRTMLYLFERDEAIRLIRSG